MRDLFLVAFAASFGCIVAACNGPDPKTPHKDDEGVPANSASEQRLSGGDAKPASSGGEASTQDPSQPYLTPVGATPDASAGGATGATATSAAGAGANAGAGAKKNGKVTREECGQVFDRFIDLSLQTDARFQGIPPEMIEQMKATAKAQAGQRESNPCDKDKSISRAQYDCAMAAPSAAEWQKCLK